MSALSAERYMDARVATVEARRRLREARARGPLFVRLIEPAEWKVRWCEEVERNALAEMERAPESHWCVSGGICVERIG